MMCAMLVHGRVVQLRDLGLGQPDRALDRPQLDLGLPVLAAVDDQLAPLPDHVPPPVARFISARSFARASSRAGAVMIW